MKLALTLFGILSISLSAFSSESTRAERSRDELNSVISALVSQSKLASTQSIKSITVGQLAVRVVLVDSDGVCTQTYARTAPDLADHSKYIVDFTSEGKPVSCGK